MSTVFAVRLYAAWNDLYRDPDQLAAVRQAISQHARARLDWSALMAIETDDPPYYSFTSRTPADRASLATAVYFGDALEALAGHAAAQAELPLDLVPMRLTREVLRTDSPISVRMCSARLITNSKALLRHLASIEGAGWRLRNNLELRTPDESYYACMYGLAHISQLVVERRVPPRIAAG